MTNAFERHGLAHVSPSSLNSWCAAPALWVVEKLFGHRSTVGPSADRGSAIEHGVNLGLIDTKLSAEACGEAALAEFDTLTAFKLGSDRDKQRAAIVPTVALALAELRQYGPPDPIPESQPLYYGKRQHKVERTLPGVSVPCIGYKDWNFGNHGIVVDLKTSLALPSSIKNTHARQGSFYVANTNDQMRFCYATPKKVAVYQQEDAAAAFSELVKIAMTIERFLSVSNDKHELAGLICPDYETFYWNSPQTKAAGLQVYGY